MLQQAIPFAPEGDAEIFASVPAAPAVFLLRGEEAGSEPYVAKTANLRRRLQRLLSPPEHGKRLNLRARARTIEYTPTGSDFESGLLLYHTLRREFPRKYAERLRLRPVPLLRLMLENEYPRLSVTTRLTTLRGRSLYYGPFATRAAAEKFANDSLDFFKLRRCTEDLQPDPAFPGCIYSEMKMCLAPCFKGCTDADYAAEAERVREWFDTGGQSLVRQLRAERDRASSNLEFEQAAALHARLEKASAVAAQVDEIVRRVDQLNGVVVQPSAAAEHVALFRIEAGRLNGPVHFALELRSTERAAKPQSMESRITEALDTLPPLAPGPAQETMEQLAYLKRWYYRSSKIGEIFFTGPEGQLPLRRLVRGVARVFRGEKPGADLNETARDYWINRGKAAQLNPDNYNV